MGDIRTLDEGDPFVERDCDGGASDVDGRIFRNEIETRTSE